ncbi:GrpE protein [Candidatus Haloredivivus sp. G17]|nr:GrpE protein [Candidatus Haloredivivus sp. G17]
MERAILSADEDSALLQGVKMVSDQLYEKLETEGLERIDAEGEEFDPNLHKAVDKKDDGKKVIEEKRKGYMFGDKVLREAEVVVGNEE